MKTPLTNSSTMHGWFFSLYFNCRQENKYLNRSKITRMNIDDHVNRRNKNDLTVMSQAFPNTATTVREVVRL